MVYWGDLVGADSIRWLPAVYKSLFQLTCYIMTVESDDKFKDSRFISGVKGLPANVSYRERFLRDVRMQGSGQAADGSIIHYEPGDRFTVQSCARTASGECAADGESVAVDRTVIPFRSMVDFRLPASRTGYGKRRSIDTGARIKGYHVDIYFGTRRRDCEKWGSSKTGELKIHSF